MKHPIMLAWLLAIIAILLNFSMVDQNGEEQAAHGQAAETTHVAEQAKPGQAVVEAAHDETTAQVGAESAPAVTAAQAVAPAEQAAPPAAVSAVSAQPTQASEADLLRAAREAYWSNELDSAVGFYTSLLTQQPDSIEYKGELANVYWKQGKAHEAAQLFTEIAPKLAAQGRVTEAFNMKLYVDMVDPELAKQIDAALK